MSSMVQCRKSFQGLQPQFRGLLSVVTISLLNPKILLRSMNACFIVSIAEPQYKHIDSLLFPMSNDLFVGNNSAV